MSTCRVVCPKKTSDGASSDFFSMRASECLLASVAAFSLAGASSDDNSHQRNTTQCENDKTKTTTTGPKKSTSQDAMIDAYLESLMQDHSLVKLPYDMGTSSPTLLHLFGVDRAIVQEAIETLESTIDELNEDTTTIVGHPIVYVLSEPSEGDDCRFANRLVHHSEFFVPWELLEQSADILWEDPRTRLGIFPEAMEKMLMMNLMNVVSAILFDLILSMSLSMNHGCVRMSWNVDPEAFQKYYQELAKDPETFKQLVKASLSQIDFDKIAEEARESVQRQQQQQPEEIKQGQEDVLQALLQLAQGTSLASQLSLDSVREQVYEMAFKLMLILYYWFTLNSEAIILGRSITQHFAKPKK